MKKVDPADVPKIRIEQLIMRAKARALLPADAQDIEIGLRMLWRMSYDPEKTQAATLTSNEAAFLHAHIAQLTSKVRVFEAALHAATAPEVNLPTHQPTPRDDDSGDFI